MEPVKEKKSDFFKTFFLAILFAVGIRTFFFESFSIPSGSMINTLLIGDFLFVNKFSYGYGKYSFPFGLAPFSGRLFYTPPQRGDVVVFRTDKQPGMDFIKRVVGLPGDRLQVKEGILYINGIPTPLKEVGPIDYTDQDGVTYQARLYQETLPNGVVHPVVLDEPQGQGSFDNTGVYEVPKDCYFMMGDHHHRSGDSRDLVHMGFIHADNLVGKASLIFFSVERSKPGLWKVWEWPQRIRWARLLTIIR